MSKIDTHRIVTNFWALCKTYHTAPDAIDHIRSALEQQLDNLITTIVDFTLSAIDDDIARAQALHSIDDYFSQDTATLLVNSQARRPLSYSAYLFFMSVSVGHLKLDNSDEPFNTKSLTSYTRGLTNAEAPTYRRLLAALAVPEDATSRGDIHLLATTLLLNSNEVSQHSIPVPRSLLSRMSVAQTFKTNMSFTAKAQAFVSDQTLVVAGGSDADIPVDSFDNTALIKESVVLEHPKAPTKFARSAASHTHQLEIANQTLGSTVQTVVKAAIEGEGDNRPSDADLTILRNALKPTGDFARKIENLMTILSINVRELADEDDHKHASEFLSRVATALQDHENNHEIVTNTLLLMCALDGVYKHALATSSNEFGALMRNAGDDVSNIIKTSIEAESDRLNQVFDTTTALVDSLEGHNQAAAQQLAALDTMLKELPESASAVFSERARTSAKELFNAAATSLNEADIVAKHLESQASKAIGQFKQQLVSLQWMAGATIFAIFALVPVVTWATLWSLGVL